MTANPPRGTLSATREGAPGWGSLPGAARFGAEPAPDRAAARPATGRGADRVPPRVTADDDWGADPIFGATSASAALAGFNAAQARPLAAARMGLFVGGGILSLALVGLIGVWGYKVVLREVLGVPVVEAEAGPMRIEPAEPGGVITADMGLSVNEVAADGTAAAPSDVLTLAPAAGDLAPEDMDVVQTDAEADEVVPQAAATIEAAAEGLGDALPVIQAAATTSLLPPAAPTTAAAVQTATLDAAPAQVIAVPSDRPMTAEEVLAFADQIAAGTAPLAPLAAAEGAPVETSLAAQPDAEVAAGGAVKTLSADIPGVAVALRPHLRPAGSVQQVTLTSAPAPDAATDAAPEPAPAEATLTASIPAGTSLVQLGAFDSAEIAAAEWERLQGPFGDFLEGKQRVIQEAESGGRTFFRLRAMGFTDLSDARRLCAALEAEDAGCIPVVTQ